MESDFKKKFMDKPVIPFALAMGSVNGLRQCIFQMLGNSED